MKKLSALFIILLIVLFPSMLLAADVTFAWDEYANNPPVTGFEIFIAEQGQEYDKDSPIWTGSIVPPATVNGVSSDVPYKAVVRAYLDGPPKIVSVDSNEVLFTISSAEAIVPPDTVRVKTILIRF